MIQVWLLGKRFADATVLDLARPALERVKKQEAVSATSDVNFFTLAEQQRRLALPPLTYSNKEGSHD